MIQQAYRNIVLAALDEGDSAIAVLQPDSAGTYRIVATNGTFSRTTNYSRAEALGSRLLDLHGPSTDTAMQQKIDLAMNLGESLRGEIEYVSRVGRPFWFGFTLMPLVDPETRCLHSVLLGRDITAKRKQDSEQSLMQALLVNVFQKIDAAVAIVRADGFFLLANAAFHALVGYGPDEVPRLSADKIVAPGYRDVVASAHARQFADGKPYNLDVPLVRKDGNQVFAHLTSVKIQRADMQSFGVVTFRPVNQPSVPVVTPPVASVAMLGCVQFLGLDAIKEAYGARWAAVSARLMLAAEGILKRRLSPGDVCSRTADQGFCIWFKSGTEDDNAERIARFGREIRIMLLGELGAETDISVCAYSQTANIEDPTASSSTIMTSLNRLMTERRLEVEQNAKEFLERVLKQLPSESTYLSDRSGRVIRGSFVDLPQEMRGRFAGAMSLVGGVHADLETGLFRLGLAANAVLEDVAQGRDDIRLTTIPFALFNTRQGREKFLQQWRSYPPSVGQKLMVMLAELPPRIGHQPVTKIAELLRSVTSRLGMVLDDIETPPFNFPHIPFSIVGLVSDSLTETSDAKLRDFIQKMHEAKARVVVRLSPTEPPQRWYRLGADLTAPVPERERN